ncbi:MAG TPA: PAS domain S-box protein [bacterium]|nr:PAS domain S-box protein [bacterium]
MQAVQEAFAGKYDVIIEYLDTKRHPLELIQDNMYRLLQTKYSQKKIDLILAFDDGAYNFLDKYYDMLFSGVPVVVTGVDHLSLSLQEEKPYITGFVDRMDPRPTIELILRLQPKTTQIYVIQDNTPTGMSQRLSVEEAAQFFPLLTFTFLDGRQMSMRDLLNEVAVLTPDSAILLTMWMRDGENEYYDPNQAAEQISQAASAPMYGLSDLWLDHGIVGGKLNSGYTQGMEIVSIARRILAGEPPQAIPIRRASPSLYMFDSRQLRRWRINHSLLPENSVVHFRHVSVLSRYRNFILSVLAFLIVQSGIIVVLLNNLRRRRASERALRDSEARYRNLLETMNEGFLIVDDHDVIRYANEQLHVMMGFTGDEVKDKSIYGLFPDKTADLIRTQLTNRRDGDNSPYEIETVDKQGNPVSFLVSPRAMFADNGSYTGSFAVITDLRQVKIAEREREQLISLIDHNNDFIGIAELSGRIIYINEAGMRLTGLESKTSFAQMDINQFMPLDEREDLAAEVMTAMLSQGFWRGEGPLLHQKTGEAITMDISTMLLRSKQTGEPTAIATIMRDISERKMAETTLRQSEQKYRTLFDASPEVTLLYDNQGIILDCNQMAPRALGLPREKMIGRHWLELGIFQHDTTEYQQSSWNSLLAQGNLDPLEVIVTRPDGELRTMELFSTLITQDGQVNAVLAMLRDITDKRKAEKRRSELETQLAQSQKMEAIGRLAGGVAHDFNNILTGILGYTELAMDRITEDDPLHTDIQEIKSAADRAAMLTQQLLAFSRKQMISPRVININRIIEQSRKMLTRIIGEDIQCSFQLSPNVGRIKIDPGQFNQVLINLVVNARDAMPDGGRLIISTEETPVSVQELASNPEVSAGNFIVLSVLDNGKGIDPEHLKLIFEPFFTTKSKDKGSGLGLATIYGIVKQNGGFIKVDSEMNRGSMFSIFFPEETAPEEDITVTPQRMIHRGSETILLVEDEQMVRDLAVKVLEHSGYKVLTAENGAEALLLAKRSLAEIDLLVTDVIMPQMNGRTLYEQLHRLKPQMKVLFISGYTADVIAQHGVLEKGMNFLQKPFVLNAFIAKVRETLDK